MQDQTLRRSVLIALGWIGTEEEIVPLVHHMLSSDDSLCRAWSAAALMQLSFNQVQADVVREKTKVAFKRVIAEEKDLFACGMMIEAAQTLFGKKWISSIAVENEDAEKIEKARKSAMRFLSKA